jgi:hypothetical protein
VAVIRRDDRRWRIVWTNGLTLAPDATAREAYVEGPWSGEAVEVVPASQLAGAVEALAELVGAVRCFSDGDLPAEDRLDAALDAADRITAGGQ